MKLMKQIKRIVFSRSTSLCLEGPGAETGPQDEVSRWPSQDTSGYQWKPVCFQPVQWIVSCPVESNFPPPVPAQVIFSSWPHGPVKDSLIVSRTVEFRGVWSADEGTDGFVRRRLGVVPKISVKCALEKAHCRLGVA